MSHRMINIIKSNNDYIKQCKLCNQIACSGNKCYAGKDNIYMKMYVQIIL